MDGERVDAAVLDTRILNQRDPTAPYVFTGAFESRLRRRTYGMEHKDIARFMHLSISNRSYFPGSKVGNQVSKMHVNKPPLPAIFKTKEDAIGYEETDDYKEKRQVIREKVAASLREAGMLEAKFNTNKENAHRIDKLQDIVFS